MIDSSASDVDEILDRAPSEIDHNKALEAGIVFEEQLDRLINSALARRINTLEQLEFYRQGLGKQWRRVSDEIIDAEATEVDPRKQIEAPPYASIPGSDSAPTSSERDTDARGEGA